MNTLFYGERACRRRNEWERFDGFASCAQPADQRDVVNGMVEDYFAGKKPDIPDTGETLKKAKNILRDSEKKMKLEL
jgi:hypoxanthine phosphoribosyltransferase